MAANLIFRLLQAEDAQDSSWNHSPQLDRFLSYPDDVILFERTQHRQKVVTTMLLLIYSLNFVPNKTFQC